MSTVDVDVEAEDTTGRLAEIEAELERIHWSIDAGETSARDGLDQCMRLIAERQQLGAEGPLFAPPEPSPVEPPPDRPMPMVDRVVNALVIAGLVFLGQGRREG